MWTYETALGYVYDGDGRAVKQTQASYRVGYTVPPNTIKYQVWSSVLGSALTELRDDGTKARTKVFAGGAVIAEQMAGVASLSSDTVEWISADPVTGSNARLKKTGAFYDDERKEYEALGQEVLPTEPPVKASEGSPGTSNNTASEPEWLCEMHSRDGTDFFELPVQCKINALESGNLIDVVITYPSNPLRVTMTDSPLPEIITQQYDDAGEQTKYVREHVTYNNSDPTPIITGETLYYVRSSVLGKVITELNQAGEKFITNVYLGNAVLAEQRSYRATPTDPLTESVVWTHVDPVTGSIQQTTRSGELSSSTLKGKPRREFEPLGAIVPHYNLSGAGSPEEPSYLFGGNVRQPEWGCRQPGTDYPMACNVLASLMNMNAFEGKSSSQKIVLQDSPLPNLNNYSTSDDLMSYTLTSSSKKDKKKKAIIRNRKKRKRR